MAKRKWADLAAWYFSDDKNEVERKCDDGWRHCENPSFIDDNKYRKKERKFNDGEWYPVVDYEGCKSVMIYREKLNLFYDYSDDASGYTPHSLTFIGESLGKLNFGGKDE